MPLTDKGTKILNSMRQTYGDEKKAKSVFYASINKGKITGAEGRALGGGVPAYAFGGLLPGPSTNAMDPGNIGGMLRNTARQKVHMGPLMGSTMGRGDKVGTAVKSGSYVLPADHVSGLGQGNTAAGFKVLNAMFAPKGGALSKGPMGMNLANIKHGGVHLPKAGVKQKLQFGGAPEQDAEPIDIQAADGEYVLTPDQIINKFGDLQKGHRALDEWVVQERRNHIHKLRKLPGPVKD